MKCGGFRALVPLALVVAAGLAAAEDTPLLIELQPEALPGDVAASGFTVVGATFDSEGFYWMPSSGVVRVGGTLVAAVSRDGRTLIGRALDPSGIEHAAIWLGGKDWRLLGSIAPDAVPCDNLLSGSLGASDDGQVIVGLAWNGCSIARAFRWEEATGMVDLGSTVADRSSRANDVSGDGRIVIGWQEANVGYRQGARWVDGRQELFEGPNGVVGEAFGANSDGSIIVGEDCHPVVQAAWVWRVDTGVVCYPPPRQRPGLPQVIAFATSEDGRVVVGAHSFGLDSESLLWIDGEPHYLKEYLRANGLPNAFEGWVNTGFINGVSPDGRVLVGYGAGPRTFTGFVVILEGA